MQENVQIAEEDEIDLRELWKILMKRKTLIVIVTIVITAIAVAYALFATSWYEAKAYVEIGTYKDGNTEGLLGDANKLSKRLQVEYIDVLKNVEDRDVEAIKIVSLKKAPAFIEIVTLGKNNDLAKNELNKIIEAIISEHGKVVGEIKEDRQAKLNEVMREINNLESNELVALNESIAYEKNTHLKSLNEKYRLIKESIKDNLKQLQILTKNIIDTKNKDASLTALNVMQRGSLEMRIAQDEISLVDIENQIKVLEEKTIKQLERQRDITMKDELAKLGEKRSLAKQALQEHNFRNSTLVGEIIINDFPVKPKKKLIMVVAFITGLILSVFLAFFLEFIQAGRNEEIEEA